MIKYQTPEEKIAQKINQDFKVEAIGEVHNTPGNFVQNSPDDSNERHHIEYEF